MQNKKSHSQMILGIIIWAISASFFFYDYIQQVIPSVISHNLQLSFHLNATTVSIIAAQYYLIYAIEQIPVGMIIDHFGPHKPLTIAVGFAAISTFLFSHADSGWQLGLFRFMTGAGAAFSFVTCLKLVSNWFSERVFAILVGLTNLVGMCGAVFGQAPLNDIVSHNGWRNTLLGLAIIGGILCLLVLFVVRNHPKNAIRFSDHNKRGYTKTLADLKHLTSNWQSWINGCYAFMINVPFAGLGALWGIGFMQSMFHINASKAALMSSMLFVGAIPGSFIVGAISDFLQKRKILMIITSLFGIIVMSILLYLPNLSITEVYVLMLLLGFSASGNVVAYAYAHDIRPEGSAGISLGFVNTCLIGGAAISQIIIGKLLDYQGGHSVFSLGDYRVALSSIVIALILAFLLACIIKEPNKTQPSNAWH